MKNTLEYKILKYLSKNSKGDFVDVSNIEADTYFLKSVIKDLKMGFNRHGKIPSNCSEQYWVYSYNSI